MDRRDFLQRGGVWTAGALAAGCGATPRSGPLTRDIVGDDDPEALEGLVARLDAAALERITPPAPPSFPPSFLSAPPIDPSRLGVDDTLDITVWESEGAGLLSAAGGGTTIPNALIDPSGRVFVPFAGPVPAAGGTLDTVRARIRTTLEAMTLSPQVDVRLREPRSRLVALQGAVARPGIYPIERITTRLSAMLAEAGGAVDLPERTEVAVERDGIVGRHLLSEIFDDPSLDIALRPGDMVLLTPIRERFIVLGATSIQAELNFPTRPLDLLSALGLARGLRDFDADPTGVFVFRYEDQGVADDLLPGPQPEGLPPGPGRPIVYRLDLSEPGGLFLARGFAMRGGDAIFATNAPLTELRKFLQIFTSVLTPVQQTTTLGAGL